nr:MAG TPA: hypothetical protein [Caudoviricetes sp.]
MACSVILQTLSEGSSRTIWVTKDSNAVSWS